MPPEAPPAPPVVPAVVPPVAPPAAAVAPPAPPEAPTVTEKPAELPPALEGQALLDKIASLKGLVTRAEMIRQCGYIARTKDGDLRQRAGAFDRAVLDAMNVIETIPAEHGRGAGGSNRVVVNAAGRITISAAHVTQAGLRSGDAATVEAMVDQGVIVVRIAEVATTPSS